MEIMLFVGLTDLICQKTYQSLKIIHIIKLNILNISLNKKIEITEFNFHFSCDHLKYFE